jgi:hypothetical protein
MPTGTTLPVVLADIVVVEKKAAGVLVLPLDKRILVGAREPI